MKPPVALPFGLACSALLASPAWALPPGGWDLSGIPPYRAETRVTGTLHLGGASMAGLVVVWEKAFQRHHPGVTFDNRLPSSDVALGALTSGGADIAPCGREPALVEVLGFTEKFGHDLTGVIVGSGAWNTPGGSSWSPVVFVPEANPLRHLTMRQLDGIFGAERTGGYPENSAVFQPSAGRGPDQDIRTWGQLGLEGGLKDQPIHTYGYADTGMRHFFELRVMQGGDKWNPNYREYVETGTKMVPPGSAIGSHDMLLALAKDPDGIGWSGLGHARSVPGLRPLALGEGESGPFYEPTEENMRNKTYPLSRNVFMYVNRAPGRPLDPRVKEFLRFVLSREGQDLLEHNGLHLPLTAAMDAEQLRRLE